MELYTIEPIIEPRDPDLEWVLRQVRTALEALEAAAQERKTPLPVIELGE